MTTLRVEAIANVKRSHTKNLNNAAFNHTHVMFMTVDGI